MEDVWRIYGGFMEDFMEDLRFMKDLWRIYEKNMEDLWGIHGGFMEDL